MNSRSNRATSFDKRFTICPAAVSFAADLDNRRICIRVYRGEEKLNIFSQRIIYLNLSVQERGARYPDSHANFKLPQVGMLLSDSRDKRQYNHASRVHVSFPRSRLRSRIKVPN